MKRLLVILGLLLLGCYLLTGVTQVRPGERAVVRRFGRVLEHKPEPGLWVGLPWGMDRVERVPVDFVRPLEIGYREEDYDPTGGAQPGQFLTGDHNLVNIRVVLSYSVKHDQVEDFVVNGADRVDALVTRAAEAALMEWAAARGIEEILKSARARLPDWLAQATRTRIEPYQLGIQIDAASVAEVQPPGEVKEAFDNVAKAQAGISTQENNARGDANRLRGAAESERVAFEQQAQAYQRDQKLQAHADAGAFLARVEQYQRLGASNPGYLAGIWYDQMGKLFAQLKKTGRIDLLDNRLGPDGLDITIFPPLPDKKP